MSVTLSNRVRGNEVISASLIEILLVIIFVLLLILVDTNGKKPDDLQQQEVCEGLKLSLERLVGAPNVADIDCSKYKESTQKVIEQVINATKTLDADIAPIWERGGFTSNAPSISEAINILDNQVKGEDKEGTRVIDDLVVKLGNAKAKIKEITENNRLLIKEKSDLKIAIAGLQEQIDIIKPDSEDPNEGGLGIPVEGESEKAGDGDGDGGKGIGACLTSNPDAVLPEHDYLLVVDLKPPGAFDVRLRQDRKHREVINRLVDEGLLPKFLNREEFVLITEEEFIANFTDLQKSGRNQNPQCMYQARLLNDEMQINQKVRLVEEVFLKGG